MEHPVRSSLGVRRLGHIDPTVLNRSEMEHSAQSMLETGRLHRPVASIRTRKRNRYSLLDESFRVAYTLDGRPWPMSSELALELQGQRLAVVDSLLGRNFAVDLDEAVDLDSHLVVVGMVGSTF